MYGVLHVLQTRGRAQSARQRQLLDRAWPSAWCSASPPEKSRISVLVDATCQAKRIRPYVRLGCTTGVFDRHPSGGGPSEARTVALAAASISRANRTSEGRSPALQPRLSASAARSIPLSRAASAGWLTNTETSMKPGSSRRLLSCPCARIARSSARERTTARAGNPTSFTALGQRRPWTIRNRPERSDHDRHLLADASGQIGGIHIRDGKPVRRP